MSGATSWIVSTLRDVVRSADTVARIRIVARAEVTAPDGEVAAVYDSEIVESFKGERTALKFLERVDRSLEPSSQEYLVFVWRCLPSQWPDNPPWCAKFPQPTYTTSVHGTTLIPLERGHSANPERLWLVSSRETPLVPLPSLKVSSSKGVHTLVDWELVKEEIETYAR